MNPPVDDALRLNSHALERRTVRHRGDDEVAGILEAYLKPRSNRWSMLGVNSNPFPRPAFAPCNRTALSNSAFRSSFAAGAHMLPLETSLERFPHLRAR